MRLRFKPNQRSIIFEFGSRYTKVIAHQRLIFYEPSLLIVHRRTKKVLALGQAAYQSLDKLNQDFIALWPIKRKAVNRRWAMALFIKALLKHLDLKMLFLPWKQWRFQVVLPSELSEAQQKVFRQSIKQVIISAQFLASRDLLARSAFSQAERFGLDLGATTSFWAFNAGEMLRVQHYYWGVKELEQLIRLRLESKYSCQLDQVTIEKIKRQLIEFAPGKTNLKRLVAKVKDSQTGLGKTVMISNHDLDEVASQWLVELLELVDDFFQRLAGPVAAGLVDHGLNLFGGLTHLHSLAGSLAPRLGCEVKELPHADLFLINQAHNETKTD